MESIKRIFKSNIRQYAMLIALLLITLFFQIATGGVLLMPRNVDSLIQQNSYVLILAIGMTFCILTGGNVDLSVGSLCAFIGAITGVLVINKGLGIGSTIAIVLLMGVLVGIWQGFWIAYVRIPAFIVTLAGMLMFRGLTINMLQGQTLSPFPTVFQYISSGHLPDFLPVIKAGFHSSTILVSLIISIIYLFQQIRSRNAKKAYQFEVMPLPFFIIQVGIVVVLTNLIAYWLAQFQGIPVVLVLIGLLVLIYSFIGMKTAPGRYVYAVGGNEKAAKLSGINTNLVLFLVYVNMAVLSAVAGVVFASRLNAASPQAGLNFELDSIAACFIGGASATGGIGTVIGAIIGALVMGVLNNGMSIMGVGSDIQMVIKGLILLLAVAFDIISKTRSK
jgi:putative multiple sugar transport system permease protein